MVHMLGTNMLCKVMQLLTVKGVNNIEAIKGTYNVLEEPVARPIAVA